MSKPKLNKDLIELLEESERRNDPKVLKVSSKRLNKTETDKTYNICSRCYSIIDQTWDHSDWCELFIGEPVTEWIKKGKKDV